MNDTKPTVFKQVFDGFFLGVMLGLFLIVILSMSSCASQREVHIVQPYAHRIDRPTWSALETSKDHFVIVAKNNEAEKEAVQYFCHKNSYICFGPENGGFVVLLERKGK